MANCIQFVDKVTNEPAILNRLDELICKHLNVDVHPRSWCRDWFNIIGERAAGGKSYDEIRTYLGTYEDWESELTPILDFLQARYRLKAWSE